MVDSYPIPDRVGEWGDFKTFRKYPRERSQWVHYEHNLKHVVNGEYDSVYPLHVELVCTTKCNFSCSWCNYRKTKDRLSDLETKKKHMNIELMRKIIDEISKRKIGIQWTGGEPLLNSHAIEGIKYASSKRINQCLFTNGLLLTSEVTDSVLKTNVKFVRISLNAVSNDIHAEFHGYPSSGEYVSQILDNIRYSIRRKNEVKSQVLFGVSIVYDKRNAVDVQNVLEFISTLEKENNGDAFDYIVIRPAFKIYNNVVELDNDIYSLVKNAVRRRKNDINAKLVFPQSSGNVRQLDSHPHYHGLLYESYKCLSCGWFSEILPSGEMLLCSDTYGNAAYVIGNLQTQSLESIWHSPRRKNVIKEVEKRKCLKRFCPKSGRGYYLNFLFHQIEQYRKRNNMEAVINWLEALKQNIPHPDHSFFI